MEGRGIQKVRKTWIRDEDGESERERERERERDLSGFESCKHLQVFFLRSLECFVSFSMRPLTATAPQLDEEPSCSSSSSSAFRLPPAPMMRREQRCASLSAPALGDLASRLDGLSHPDVERIAANGVRLSPTKYARPAWMISRGDPRAERGAGRPNVEVPFASEPGALREFLWGELKGGDVQEKVMPFKRREVATSKTRISTSFSLSPKNAHQASYTASATSPRSSKAQSPATEPCSTSCPTGTRPRRGREAPSTRRSWRASSTRRRAASSASWGEQQPPRTRRRRCGPLPPPRRPPSSRPAAPPPSGAVGGASSPCRSRRARPRSLPGRCPARPRPRRRGTGSRPGRGGSPRGRGSR